MFFDWPSPENTPFCGIAASSYPFKDWNKVCSSKRERKKLHHDDITFLKNRLAVRHITG